MDKSGIFVGGVIGAVMVAVMFAVLLVSPSELPKPDIMVSNGHSTNTVGETTPVYSKNLSLIEIFEKSEPGVVRVNVQKIETVDGANGVGSGFVFDKKGHIVTNAHVIDSGEKVVVTFLDGRSYNAKIIGVDEFTDIAVIKVNADLSLLRPLLIGDSSNLKVGEQIAAIGNPFGLSGSMTSGIISQLGRLLPSGADYSIPDVIQTDAAINPGNSGGPLLNMRGEVVGINTAIQSGTGEFTGVGFAVPSKTVAKIVPTLVEKGNYEHPWIGISGRDIDPDLAKVLKLTDAVGFLVVIVVENSPAAKAGLIGSENTVTVGGTAYPIGGDIILAVDGIEVRQIDDILIHLQRAKSIGDEITLEILRDGRTTNVTIILQERPNGN
ncbi:S1C family serine protease [Nitrosopumilus sp.]|uniref:S1C family serine protease n=1 Tax=Nitrosopumilus sp. TaxID=2024843 RepID=UPI00292EAEA5|nr:trypsin-like peptidase domain-containing protein [Nitrosopumilus sp.]